MAHQKINADIALHEVECKSKAEKAQDKSAEDNKENQEANFKAAPIYDCLGHRKAGGTFQQGVGFRTLEKAVDKDEIQVLPVPEAATKTNSDFQEQRFPVSSVRDV